MNILKRPRRLRTSAEMRSLVRETELSVNDFILPVFVVEGQGIKQEIPSMPGVHRFSIDVLLEEMREVSELKIPGILFFGIPDHKDSVGTGAYAEDGIVQKAIRAVKSEFPKLILIADVCLCEYTDHGHCGIVKDGTVLNDPTLKLIGQTALSLAKAGADVIAPSDMMDGRVGHIRRVLDEGGYENISIMAYSAKYSSSFYGPFRDAANSAPQFGDRKSYQMDYSNYEEAIREVALDIEEGADIVMVKPAVAYLDVLKGVRDRFHFPLAAYHVSGEYAMIKAAALNGWIDEKSAVLETMTAIKRAGAKMIITYYAKDVAKYLKV